MLDRSGSVGEHNFNTAISFLQSVVSFFPIASNETQVSVHVEMLFCVWSLSAILVTSMRV